MSDKQILIRVSKDLHKTVALLAFEKGISRTKLVIQILEKYLNPQNE